MKQELTLLLMALLTGVGSLNAKTTTTTLWEGTYMDGIELNSETVAALEAGNVLRVYVTVPEGGANFKICYKGAGNDWTETALPSINNQWHWVNSGDSYKDFTLTDEDISALAGMNIYIYKGENSTINKVSKLVDNPNIVEVVIGTDGICTWSCDKNLNFAGTGITAYYASAVSKGQVTLTSTETTHDWQGYILVGETGTYDVPVANEAYYPSENYLQQCVNGSSVAASTEGTYHYIFAKNSSGDIAFYKLTTDHTLGAKKAYLETATDITPDAGVKAINLIFNDEETDINTVQSATKDDEIYTLNGIRVAKPKRGLYITGGRKVFVK